MKALLVAVGVEVSKRAGSRVGLKSDSMMEYKEYIAAIEYDDSVEMFHGEVVNAGPYPIATFEATDVAASAARNGMSINDWVKEAPDRDVDPPQLSSE